MLQYMKHAALIYILLTLLPVTTATAGEHEYAAPWCAAHSGQVEVRLKDGTRADCLTKSHAIEVDYARKWCEGLGQALHYARLTGRRPAVVLIMGPGDGRFQRRLEAAIRYYELEVEIYTIPK